MSKVLVIGDLLMDHSIHGTATRLCPEAPCPVIVPDGPAKITRGGAGLVTDQLRELIGKENVIAHFGSKSIKKRVFADGRLICRVDHDSVFVSPREVFWKRIHKTIDQGNIGQIIVSDYGKGAFDRETASGIMSAAQANGIPVFVDAKKSWEFYIDAFAMFPNQKEQLIFPARSNPKHLIQKLGADGCKVDGDEVRPLTGQHLVRDTCGAGDIFLAAFIAYFRSLPPAAIDTHAWLKAAGQFANRVAGISVQKIGTHIVTREELASSY